MQAMQARTVVSPPLVMLTGADDVIPRGCGGGAACEMGGQSEPTPIVLPPTPYSASNVVQTFSGDEI